MQAPSKRVLFISHDASVSGATMVLLALLKWLKANTDLQMAVLMNEEGPLANEFKEVAETYLYQPPARTHQSRVISLVDRKLLAPTAKKNHRQKLLSALQAKKFDLVYNNTIVNGEMLDYLQALQCPVISHIHELQFVIDCFGGENAAMVSRNTKEYIAVSKQVKENLTERLKISGEKITVIPPFVDFTRVDKLKGETDVITLKRELGIPAQAFVIGCAGSVEWRKGPDIFVQMAAELIRQSPDVYFIWTGGIREKQLLYKLEYDAKKAGIAKQLKFIGPRSNPYPYFEILDLFVLTSREDPYPLVCIESLYLNKPVVCFEQSGGIPDLVRKYDAGKAVEYLNAAKMASVIKGYIVAGKDKQLNVDIPQLVAEHSVGTVSKQILEVIMNTAK